MDRLLVNDRYRLEKIPEKGGWTYIALNGIPADEKRAFGMVRVKGTIDGFEINDYNLMPMGTGQLFLPVKAEIRKKIKKQAGDHVTVVLYRDDSLLHVPEALLLCLKDVPEALTFFNSLADNEKRNYITWIFSAKRDETKASRILKTIIRLTKNLRMYDKEED